MNFYEIDHTYLNRLEFIEILKNEIVKITHEYAAAPISREFSGTLKEADIFKDLHLRGIIASSVGYIDTVKNYIDQKTIYGLSEDQLPISIYCIGSGFCPFPFDTLSTDKYKLKE